MASLGFRTINEMVGRAQFLKKKEDLNHWKLHNLQLADVLYVAHDTSGNTLYQSETQDHEMESILDWKLLENARASIESREPTFGTFEVKNTDRALGTLLSNEVSKAFGSEGLPDNTINFKFNGYAGQSFGAFAAKGLSLELEGEANDYVGKGLSGAQLTIYPRKDSLYEASDNIIIGNVALYGATSGRLFVHGQAGERFAVRNSGATSVVEGLGDHGCEYMTGGRVLVLGETGRNFAAGMSGGIAWIYDRAGTFSERCNQEMVDLERLDAEDESQIIALLKQHVNLTKSALAMDLLNNWKDRSSSFVKVFPKEYKQVLMAKALINQ
jgi:glutamate synthase (NADPH/NADH) large chain